ncbi:DUF2852 domain-containing protein [Paenochrobactrum glaciei]|uniref:DUF2852 domain-containing protein n=1 Tax=Paenochrobactrum glaciei TaxID=486407 RepID=A0ABN1FSG0_9HYPH
MKNAALIRPAWTPVTIALMVIGFVVFWPLGLAMLAYIIWGDRLDGLKKDVNATTDNVMNAARKGFGNFDGGSVYRSSGNAAFDEWRDQELARLEAERRKLDEAKAEFELHMKELRRARDRQEFERFMEGRSPKGDISADQA